MPSGSLFLELPQSLHGLIRKLEELGDGMYGSVLSSCGSS